ncbi:beta-carotene ketolase [filamentous cyanobacterium CCP3]|nr:beta-carotene ketolase [filamentous cyanobacterium CCP3]
MVSQVKSRYCGSFSDSYLSLYWASLIVLIWFVSLVGSLTLLSAQTHIVYLLVAVAVRTFFHTGLFIVTHEAIHHNISSSRKFNDAFGHIGSWFYALLFYEPLARNHHLHHRFPATERDPDHHGKQAKGFWAWYAKFMSTYQADGQVWISLTGFTVIFGILITCQVSIANILLFWVLPMVLSSFQLFTFGIYLPHRRSEKTPDNRHCARNIHASAFWSFISCYHFGYHLEHHLHPHLPWYQLPQAYRCGNP